MESSRLSSGKASSVVTPLLLFDSSAESVATFTLMLEPILVVVALLLSSGTCINGVT